MSVRVLILALLLAHPGILPAQTIPEAATAPPAADAASPAQVPPTIDRLWKRGEEAYRAGNLEESLQAFGEALAEDEGRARSWNYVGGVHFARGDWFKALLDFKKALELDPRDVRACNNIGTVYERLDQLARAEEYYLKAILIDPAYPTSHRNLGVLYALRLGRPAEARRAWQRYLELAPPGPEAEEVRKELEKLPN